MNFVNHSLRFDEQIAFALRSLYEQYGYTRYRMSKFEEYELYVQNKDFIASPGIITFTDTDGKLLALKPDVTLSIVKNLKRRSGTQKVYYNENVYRVSKSSGSYREILQTGLEAIGDITAYDLAEVLLLAIRSLEATGCTFRLDLSHMGILSELVRQLPLGEDDHAELLLAIKRKNAEGIRDVCRRVGAMDSMTETIATAATLYGCASSVIPTLRALLGKDGNVALDELELLVATLSALGYGEAIGIDLSIVGDMSYYCGLMFRGYIAGIPDGVLLGGCYDSMMKKMGRNCAAVGFAISLDMLDLLPMPKNSHDFDFLLQYSKDIPAETVLKAVSQLVKEGKTVRTALEPPSDVRVGQVLKIQPDGSIVIVREEDTQC